MGANGVKVLSAVNARREQLVNSVATERRAPRGGNARREQLANSGANEVRANSGVNARPERLVNRAVNGVRAPSVVNDRPEQAVSVDHSSVAAVVREDQVVFCGCSL